MAKHCTFFSVLVKKVVLLKDELKLTTRKMLLTEQKRTTFAQFLKNTTCNNGRFFQMSHSDQHIWVRL